MEGVVRAVVEGGDATPPPSRRLLVSAGVYQGHHGAAAKTFNLLSLCAR